MRALGEEPARFQKLREGLWEKWDPTDALQEELVDCQARAVWRCQRADRMQEGYLCGRPGKRTIFGRTACTRR